MSDSTTLWLLAAFGFCLALWFIDIALQCAAWLRDRRLRAQLDLARRHPSEASASPARPHSGHGRTQPAGILKFQIEQSQILRPKPNGHAPHHHHRNPNPES